MTESYNVDILVLSNGYFDQLSKIMIKFKKNIRY